MNRNDILYAFTKLDELLTINNVRTEAFVVGGAAMVIAYNSSRSTRDVDAYFSSTKDIYPFVHRVGEDLGLPLDWLNDAAKGFMPPGRPHMVLAFNGNSLKVFVCTSEYLLAMKLFSARSKDLEDAVILWNLLGYRSAEEGLALLSRTYPSNLLVSKMEYFVYEVSSMASKEK